MNNTKLYIYTTKAGKVPFREWHESLDRKARAVIRTRLDRVELGNYGDCKLIKNGYGLWELRINYGPGYRVYFGKKGHMVAILLIGGNKSSQIRDIEKAKRFWLECKELLYE